MIDIAHCCWTSLRIIRTLRGSRILWKCRGENALSYLVVRAIGSGRRSYRGRVCYHASASRLPSVAGALRQQPQISTNPSENHYYGDTAQRYFASTRLLAHCCSGFAVLIGRVSANGLGYPRISAPDLAPSQAWSSPPPNVGLAFTIHGQPTSLHQSADQEDPRPRRQDG